MEIGNQIKQLRLRRGITQEAMAQHFGITPQAISKWERGVATPDIAMLPSISAYFGVTIDELFALSDDTRMERIQNMIWDVRFFEPADVENHRNFLLEKGKREPENDKVYELLADMENHLANEHRDFAAHYSREALKRNPHNKSAHASLVEAMGGHYRDWYVNNHFALIQYYKDFIEENPTVGRAYMWLMDQLLDAGRIDEAAEYCKLYQEIDHTFRSVWYLGLLCWHRGDKKNAYKYWDQMQQQFPDDWMVFQSMGDIMARSGEYEQAKAYYRKSLVLQNQPRFCDPFESIAQVCELQGNIPEAIDVLKEELEVQRTEWNTSSGETTDVVRINILRLEQLQA